MASNTVVLVLAPSSNISFNCLLRVIRILYVLGFVFGSVQLRFFMVPILFLVSLSRERLRFRVGEGHQIPPFSRCSFDGAAGWRREGRGAQRPVYSSCRSRTTLSFVKYGVRDAVVEPPSGAGEHHRRTVGCARLFMKDGGYLGRIC